MTGVRQDAECACDAPTSFAGTLLGPRRHICAFFNSTEEEYDILLPFIREGFDRGEKAYHVVDPKMCAEHVRRLEGAGIDVDAGRERGQFEFYDWEEAYLPGGHFDQDRMLAMWQETFEAASENGYPRTRLVAHMEWCLEEREGVSDLLEYEARYNLLPHPERDTVVCTYDLNRYSAAFIIDIMRTHPMIIVGGLLQDNPFYTPPDQFLRELRARKEKPG